MNKPKISIITVTLNNKEYLERAIKSVVEQTYNNIEYIVIDGGSTDGSLDIIKRYEDKIDYWVSEEDNGLYDAMNKGIRKAKGDWILILNSDDYYINNNVIEKAVEYLDDSGKYFYYFTMIHEYANGKKKTYKYPIHWWNKFKLYYSAYIPHMTLWVTRKQYEDIGLYDTNFKIAGDHDLILRLIKKYKPFFINMPLTAMRMGGMSAENYKLTFEEFKMATIKNGLPKWLADLIFRFKILKYKLFKD